MNNQRTPQSQQGQLSLQILIIGFITAIILSGFVVWADTYVRNVGREEKNTLAFGIAEAGVEYYRWHLAHDPTDFKDGTGQAGPYVHAYYDKDGNKIGQFSLVITAPASGTTIVTVESTGSLDWDASIRKIIKARLGFPSLAKYSVVGNSDLRFGEGTEVYGQLHSNGGIHFDGVAYNVVTSAKDSYNDPDHSGNVEFGVHTHVSPIDPNPPTTVPVRTDVFKAGRQFPVPAIDFAGFTQNLSDIKSAAQASGFYRGASNKSGYHIVLKTNDTFDLYRVDSLFSAPKNCPQSQKNWGTWSIGQETLLGNYSFPTNGMIFIEDDLWVDGQINTARLTLAAGKFPDNPAQRKSITVNNDLLYTNYDGQDVIGLIAQENFNTGLKSADDLRVDAAIVAQNGRIGRFYNSSKCGAEYIRDTITLYGMLASNERYGFAYTDGTGYQNRVIVYDANLLYGPPPGFPLTASTYEIISWEEVK